MKISTITHFTQLEYFKKIILEKRFIPRYNKEEITHQMNSDSTQSPSFYIPMVCFCDTDVNIGDHIRVYKGPGIGFTKEWAISKGLIPVMYLHPHTKLISKLNNLMVETASEYGKANETSRNSILERHTDLFTITLFTKRYEGYFERIGENYIFYNEREWRYIPFMESQVEYSSLPLVIKHRNNEISLKNYYHLTFDYNDVQAIYVTNVENDSLLEFINQNDLITLKNKINLLPMNC